MFERPTGGDRAVLVHLEFPTDRETENPEEFRELVHSAGAEPVAMVLGSRKLPNAKLFAGQGKVDEIHDAVAATGADVVLFNHALSPSQERNLEQALRCRVLDRTGLILDIFAQRARTHEGKLQVELAQLEHLSTRLIRGWTHLERQKGGIGLRGPGETQLETDRRLLRDRIKAIHQRLNKVRKQREQGRRARRRQDVLTVSLVGYTNAGKSTLFNALTSANVYAEDQLFATLDPTLRRLNVPDLGHVVIADTVGFIRHLPHQLVEAFRATLEETLQADLLLHVIDAADPNRLDNIEQVEAVLQEIGADAVPTLRVYNKIDQVEGVNPQIDHNIEGEPARAWVSARSGAGLDALRGAIADCLSDDMHIGTLLLSPDRAKLRSLLYAKGCVQQEKISADGDYCLDVRVQASDFTRMLKAVGMAEQQVRWQQAAESDAYNAPVSPLSLNG